MKIFRWIAVAGVGLAAWYAVFVVGLLTYGPVERLLCPAGDFISGTCMNPTVEKLMNGWIVLFVGLSGIGVVAAASWAAPERKVLTAWLALVAGGVVAVYFAVKTEMYVAGGAAIVLGAATAAAIGKRVKTIGPLGPGGAT